MDTRRTWAVRAGNAGQADAIFIDGRQVAIGSAGIEVNDGEPPPSPHAFQGHALDGRCESAAKLKGQLFSFVHEMRIGDRVIYPRKQDRTLRWGEVSGPYVFEAAAPDGFVHRRGVNWIASETREAFSQGALFELASDSPLREVKTYAPEFIARFESAKCNGRAENKLSNNAEGTIRDIAESTADFIAGKLRAEMKGFPLEHFVADLFRAMGYRAQCTRAVRDGGIDVIAHRDELGIEPPILKIQVKAHEANIGADAVKAFYAMVHERDVGIFITTSSYTAPAREFARDKGNLKLVTGAELIGLIQKYYDNLTLKYRQQIPLRRVLVPDSEALHA